MKNITELTPMIATHPGELILDELNCRGISQSSLAKEFGLEKSYINEVIKGKRSITPKLALFLESSWGISAKYWLDFQQNYDLDKAKINSKDKHRRKCIAEWHMITNNLSTHLLLKEGVLNGDPVNDVPIVYNIFGIKQLSDIENVSCENTFFRQSNASTANIKNIITWYHLVKYKSKQLNVGEFNYHSKDQLIKELKNVFMENYQLKDTVHSILNSFGIKLIYQKIENASVDGACFWSDGQPAIAMSLRYNRLDYFAFTLFHELAHVFEHLINDNTSEFLDSEDNKDYNDEKERFADKFAKESLIKNDDWENFLGPKNFYQIKDNDIIDFANRLNIPPAIVLGRLKYHFNNYKRRSEIPNSIS